MSEVDAEVKAILAELAAHGSEENRKGMARFGINADRAYGVPLAILRPMARPYRRRHDLALALWATGKHEPRIFATIIEDPKQITARQADGWVADFDSWDICDQASMNLFAATPFVLEKIDQWARDEREFVRRAAFATIAGYSVHAKKAPDADFLPFLDLIERYAHDGRNFVKKAVNWALRQIGKRSATLHPKALALAEQLAASADKSERWVGRDAVKELNDPRKLARLGLS